uniref:Damage-control phosphatase ARMT1-like metal-binding domain-containing protein n=1 Tax=Solanum lycopersicum TaxID=4081 RepID=K4B488_SOLLC
MYDYATHTLVSVVDVSIPYCSNNQTQFPDEENAKAISLFEDVVQLNDAIEDEAKRMENLVKGIFAGNLFDLGSAQLACGAILKGWHFFLASCQNLIPRPWVIDDLDTFITKCSRESWKKVILAANDLRSINDVTYPELVKIISKVVEMLFNF